MKKLLTLAIIAGMVAFAACGGSDKDKKQPNLDSMKAAEQNKKDSALQAEKEKNKQDSMKKAEELKNKPQGNYHPGNQTQNQQTTTTHTTTVSQQVQQTGNRPGATKK